MSSASTSIRDIKRIRNDWKIWTVIWRYYNWSGVFAGDWMTKWSWVNWSNHGWLTHSSNRWNRPRCWSAHERFEQMDILERHQLPCLYQSFAQYHRNDNRENVIPTWIRWQGSTNEWMFEIVIAFTYFVETKKSENVKIISSYMKEYYLAIGVEDLNMMIKTLA